MSQSLSEAVNPKVTWKKLRYPPNPSVQAFLSACRCNDGALALQLAPDLDTTALTYGLNSAIRSGHVDLAQRLLEAGAKWDGATVHLASASFDAVKLLVGSGYDVNTVIVPASTILLFAVRHNDEACIRYLLECGANPNLGPPLDMHSRNQDICPVDNAGWALNDAAAYCSTEIFALIVSYGANLSNAIPLHYAAGRAENGTPDRIFMLEYLEGLGLDIDATDGEYGFHSRGTPLQYAVLAGRVKEATWLLERGANPDKKSLLGVSARDEVKRMPPDHELVALFAAY